MDTMMSTRSLEKPNPLKPYNNDSSIILAEILRSIFDPEFFDDSPERTAERVIGYWREMVPDGEPRITTFPATQKQMIVVRDIEFSSLCAHHLLPFFGRAHIGYVPNTQMVGLSKVPRVVEYFSRRPQTQEKLAEQIASFLKHRLEAMGVAVVMEAHHTCMGCRGVRKQDAIMVTSEMRGVFLTDPTPRHEFLSLIGK